MKVSWAALTLAAVVACGSTVQTRGLVSGDGLSGSGDGLSVGNQTTGGQGQAGTTGAGRSAGGSTTGVSRTTSPSQLPDVSGAITAPAATISVGIPYLDQGQTNAFVGSLGNGLATGDTKAATAARIADLNKHGGILGHKLVAYYHQVDINSSPGEYQQAACAAFTQDHKVQYVVDIGLGSTFLSCLTRAGVGIVSTANALLTRAGFRHFPGFVQPDAMALDRLAETQASQFLAMGLFGNLKLAKVGILYFDKAEFIAAEQVLERELSRRGITVAARQALHYVASTNDVPQTASEDSSAVLKFRSAGVTHVLAVEENAWLTGGFGIAAASQSYYPRYGFTSNEPLGNIAANVPARELRDALFIGWDPVYDVPDTRELTPAGKACLRFFAHTAQDTPNQRAALVSACESVEFLRAALTAAGSANGAQSLVAGATRLTGFASGFTFRVGITRDERDGVAAYRPGRFDDTCSCFAYTGPERRA
jgi:hypothetical protein